MKKVRLFLNINILKNDQIIDLKDNDFDYLIKVMRHKINDQILVFNGINGEFLAEIITINKKNCQIRIIEKTQEIITSSNITLAFAPVKNVRMDFVAAKATEMGVNKFQPIITNHSVVDKINEKKFSSNIKEAAEQCERFDVPKLEEIRKLNSYLKTLDEKQILILCDESGTAEKPKDILPKIKLEENQEIVIFIGPEGGFSKEEFETFYRLKNINRVSLGQRILRSDTAIISALALVNEFIY